MADLTDEGIRRALTKIRNNDQTNWLAITYAEGTSDHFILAKSGTGSLAELASFLTPTFKGYLFVRLSPSPRKPNAPRFILIQYVGEECTALHKARVIVHVEDVRTVFNPISGELFLSNPKDLTMEKINANIA